MMTLAEIRLQNGSFVVFQDEEGPTFGLLSLGTPMGALRTRCDLPTHRHGVGYTRTELEIAPFDFASAAVNDLPQNARASGDYEFAAMAMNDLMQDALASGRQYIETVGRFESQDTQAAFYVIMKAALGDEECRQFLTDLVQLAHMVPNEAFATFQQQLAGIKCDAMSKQLAGMTPDQVQKLDATYRRAYGLVQDALPWLTEGLRKLFGDLREGRFAEARESMMRRYREKYAETSLQTQNEVGRADPVEHYTVGGAPINVGKYRDCVGCTCSDPCADGSCASCCDCSSGHAH